MRRYVVAAATLTMLLLTALPVLATHIQPRAVTGDQSCGMLTPGTVEFKVNLADITGAELGTDPFKVTLVHNAANGTIDFNGASLPVMGAYVQGETGGNLYA